MKKKQYIKPQVEELDGAISMILAVSGDAIDQGGYDQFGGSRQYDNNVFAEDDDNYDE